MNDEISWKEAFVFRFKKEPFSRIESEWKQEYLTRLRIHSQWKNPMKAHRIDPKIQSINRIYPLNNNLICGSIETGKIVSLNKHSGKLSKNILYVSDNQEPLQIGALEIKDGVIVAGTIDGVFLHSFIKSNGAFSDWFEYSVLHESSIEIIKIFDQLMCLSISIDGHIKLWNLGKNKFICSFIGNNTRVFCVQICGGYLVVGTERGIHVWDSSKIDPKVNTTQPDQEMIKLISTKNSVKTIYFNPEIGLALVEFEIEYSENYWPFQLIDLESGEMTSTIQTPHLSKICTSQYLFDNTLCKSLFFTGDIAGSVSIYIQGNSTYNLIKTINIHNTAIQNIFLTPTVVFIGSSDGSMSIHNYMNFDTIRTIGGMYSNQPNNPKPFKFLSVDTSSVSSCHGNLIINWLQRTPPSAQKRRKKISIGGAKGYSKREIFGFQDEVNKAMDEIELENAERVRKMDLVESVNGKVRAHGMSDQDLLEYAILVSMENESVGEEMSEQEMIDMALAMSLSENN
jgi:WD40 repeat protein